MSQGKTSSLEISKNLNEVSFQIVMSQKHFPLCFLAVSWQYCLMFQVCEVLHKITQIKNETHLMKLVEEHGRTDAPEAKEGGRDRCNSRFSRMANSPGNRFSNRVIGVINDVSHSTSAVAIRDTGIA